MIQSFGISSVQKVVDLTTPAKKENESSRPEFSDQEIDIFGLKSCLKLDFQINYTKPHFS